MYTDIKFYLRTTYRKEYMELSNKWLGKKYIIMSLSIFYIFTNTGHFIMFSVITNIYNKKTKGPTLMELFTATGKLKKSFFDN
jgi:hypothetical protein